MDFVSLRRDNRTTLMPTAPASLTGLLNLCFDASHWTSLADLLLPAARSITATSTGEAFLPGGSLFTVVRVSDTAGTVTLAETENGTLVTHWTLRVVGVTADAVLVHDTLSAGEFAAVAACKGGTRALLSATSMIATTPVPQGLPIHFDASNAYITTACFAQGTRIRTARGEVAVEALREGDAVPTVLHRRWAPVCWIGRRRLSVARHPRPWDVAPVRVRAGAFADGVPLRDVKLSPDHAVMAGGVLIPIRYLCNGATIAQEMTGRITYFHVELDAHDVLLAEGMPAESYLDTGNRSAFENADRPVQLVADFVRPAVPGQGCLPLLTGGAEVDAARLALARRAEALGWQQTADPALRVQVRGRALPVQRAGRDWRVELPANATEICLQSRHAIPAETTPQADRRRLGVALSGLLLDDAPPAPDAFGTGWHAPEAPYRWTDGAAHLRVAGARELRFRLAWQIEYWRAPDSAAAQTA